MNCIAIDDEPLALNVIREFCRKIDFINLLDTFTNPFDAMKHLNRGEVDVMFLDIHMPNITGMEFFRSLTRPPLLIFTTAFTQHALEGFELDAIDYLVKPIPFQRFLRAVNKANELLLSRKNIQNPTPHVQASGYMMVKAEYKTIKVNFNEIKYVEGVKDYVKLGLTGKNILTKTTMKNIEDKLPSDKFIRVHKSFIVSIDYIKAIENNMIIIDDKRIPIGDNYKENFNGFLDSKRI